MSEQFKRYVEELKVENVDTMKIKGYILRINNKLNEFRKNSDEELTKQECIDEFMEAYKEDLNYDKTMLIGKVFPFLMQYTSYKEILNLYKSNRVKFKKVVEEARKREKTSRGEIIRMSLDSEEQVIRSLMGIIRENPNYKEKDMLTRIQACKSGVSEELKEMLINSIQSNVAFLEEYGILDSYIDETNNSLEFLNLNELKITKRNPIADEYGDGKGNFIKYDEEKKCFIKHDENGNVIKDGEDLTKYDEDPGVIDMFDEEYLKKLSPEDLLMLDMFWRAKSAEERMEMSKAMSVIRDLDLWDIIVNDDKSKISEIDDSRIINSLKSYYEQKYEFDNPKEEENPTPKRSIFKRKSSKKKIETEPETKKEIVDKQELENLSVALRDLVLEECIIIGKLRAKDFSIRGWGTLNNEKTGAYSDETVFAMDNANFRGPVIMSVPTEELKRFFGVDEVRFPEYKGVEKLDYNTSAIMEKLYLPTSNYFKRVAMKKYKENPSSKALALLTGKKLKEAPSTDDNDAR